jgi:prepilin-type N-terminal cleavage/methylation domain-containing protein
MLNKKSKFSGFTLIELLVVIGVLGVLVSGIIVAVNPNAQLAKARNSARKNSLKQIADALERYRTVQGTYPVTTGWCGPTGSAWAAGCPNPAEWIPGIISSGEMKVLPKDPREGQVFPPCNAASYTYFIYYSNGTDYKVLAHCTLEGTPPAGDPFLDPARPTYSWAVWSPGAAAW